MHYCKHCGTPLSDDAKFCHSCGKSQDNGTQHTDETRPTPPVNSNPVQPPQNGPKLCCPECGNKNLQALSETNSSTNVETSGYSTAKGCLGLLALGPFGLLCGTCGNGSTVQTSITTTNFWICNNCGHKFRTKEDMEKELAEEARLAKAYGSSKMQGISSTVLFVLLFYPIFEIFKLCDVSDEKSTLIALVIDICITLLVFGFFKLVASMAKNRVEVLKKAIEEIEEKMSRFQ